MKRVAVATSLAACCCCGPVLAAPPFLTDDPVPVDYHAAEVYVFMSTDVSSTATSLDGPALEVTYGIAPNTQVSIQAPYVFYAPVRGLQSSGYGDTEAGLKYRFVQETRSSPQIALYPAVEFATGNAAVGGNGRTWYSLPLWAQKSWGSWTTDAGGGYAINTAPGQRNYAFGGWMVERDFGTFLTLGAELYYQGATTTAGRYSTLYNVGGYYKPSDTVNVLFSVGHSIAGDDHAVGYVGLYFFIRSKSDRSTTASLCCSSLAP